MQKMADAQDMTQAISKAAIETTKTTVQVMVVTRAKAVTKPRTESGGIGTLSRQTKQQVHRAQKLQVIGEQHFPNVQ